MKRRWRPICLWFIAGAAMASPSIQSGVRITVRFVNSGLLTAAALAKGESEASRLLSRAGVRVEWIHCDDPAHPCREERAAQALSLQLLQRRPENLHGDAAGFAVIYPVEGGTDGYAAVSYPDVQRVARELDAEEWRVLAVVMAHEIGHLLSGGGHSREGVMCARIGRRQMDLESRGELRFTADQSERMREAVLQRWRPAAPRAIR